MRLGRILLAGVLVAVACDDDDSTGNEGACEGSLCAVETWMYQIQGLEEPAAVDVLATTEYDLLVLEPTYTLTGDEQFDVSAMLDQLRDTRDGSKRVLLAYIDIGQAEDYRTYWQDDWTAPTPEGPGDPDFLTTIDPDGWSGSYTVAYWNDDWQQLWLGDDGLVAELAHRGFDGVYLDWIEAYNDDSVRTAASAEDVAPEAEMVDFVCAIGGAGQGVNEHFVVVPQNAPYLPDDYGATGGDPDDYYGCIDGLAVEDTWFGGEGDAPWDDPAAGDIPNTDDDQWGSEGRLQQYEQFLDRGLPIFTVDYCVDPTNAAAVYEQSASVGLVPLVTRVDLSQLTETPPPSGG